MIDQNVHVIVFAVLVFEVLSVLHEPSPKNNKKLMVTLNNLQFKLKYQGDTANCIQD